MDNTSRALLPTAGWMLHWLLRMGLASYLLVYGGIKVVRSQMGELDYAQALIMLGEKSPMGLLWTFMGYSPVLEIGAGIAEVVAALLLLWRRTAWLGGLLALADMAIVFLLNMTHDVPVKQLSLGLAVAGLLVAVPEFQRLGAFVLGRASRSINLPRAVPWPKVHQVTKFFPVVGIILSMVVVAQLGRVTGQEPNNSPIAGVYEIADDQGGWRHIALGQHEYDPKAQSVTGTSSVRTADGLLYYGSYDLQGDQLTVTLGSSLGDSTSGGVQDGVSDQRIFTVDGLTLTDRGGVVYQLKPMEQATYLFDRKFSWAPGTPVNR